MGYTKDTRRKSEIKKQKEAIKKMFPDSGAPDLSEYEEIRVDSKTVIYRKKKKD